MRSILSFFSLKESVGLEVLHVIFGHRDHDHVHVVYNSVNNSGYTISDGCDVERAIAICQVMTREYGLHWGQGKKNVNRDRLKGKAKVKVKYAIYDAAQEALDGTKTWAQFIKRMKDAGIEVKLTDRGKGKSPGIVFTKGTVSFAGGKVDKSLTFGSLFWKLCYVGDVLPEGVESPGEYVNHSREVLEERERLGLPPIGESKRESRSVERFLSSFSDDSSSDFFDTKAIAETASNIQAAAVQAIVGPTTIAPSVGGGGGGSSKGWRDDDEKKKKRNSPHRSR